MFHVEVEGAPERFEAALESAGVRIVAADAVEGASPGADASEAEALEAGAGEPRAPAETRRGWTVAMPLDEGAGRLLHLAGGAGVRVRSMGQVAEDLEDIFLRILDDPTPEPVTSEARNEVR